MEIKISLCLCLLSGTTDIVTVCPLTAESESVESAPRMRARLALLARSAAKAGSQDPLDSMIDSRSHKFKSSKKAGEESMYDRR